MIKLLDMLCIGIGYAIERTCSRWPGVALVGLVLACYVVGALIDGA
jgi:MFS superfamily sulfate permease-like transporter